MSEGRFSTPIVSLGLRIHRSFGTDRLIMLEELGGVYYVVVYKPRKSEVPLPFASGSLTEQVGQKSEFCREGYAVVWEQKIPAAEAHEMFRLLSAATVPAVSGGTCGLDGNSYELFWGDGFNGASFRWWGSHPSAEWAAFGKVAEMLKGHMVLTGFD